MRNDPNTHAFSSRVNYALFVTEINRAPPLQKYSDLSDPRKKKVTFLLKFKKKNSILLKDVVINTAFRHSLLFLYFFLMHTLKRDILIEIKGCVINRLKFHFSFSVFIFQISSSLLILMKYAKALCAVK